MDLATAGPADFEALVGTTFRSATADGERVDLTLIAIERGPDDPDARPFRLLFRGSSTTTATGDRLAVQRRRSRTSTCSSCPRSPTPKDPSTSPCSAERQPGSWVAAP